MVWSKEDRNAVMSSEIFREYYFNSLRAEAKKEPKSIDAIKVFEEFEAFEKKVRQSPQMKKAFQALQHKFSTDPDYTAKVDPKFVEGVMLLNLKP